MSLPSLATWLIRISAPRDRVRDVIGDFEEVHRERVQQRGAWVAARLTDFEAVHAAAVMLAGRMGDAQIVGVSWLDVKLGTRMLLKYPGLTFVGGLAMAFAIWVGAVTFEILGQMSHPHLPIDGGDRVVAILSWDLARSTLSAPFPADYLRWREQVRTVREIGAFRDISPNLSAPGGSTGPIEAAEITASGLALPHVPPYRGRLLMSADEQSGAPSVVVLGYELWQTRFGADPDVVGTTVGLDGEPTNVVGVMPEGFAFPVSHSAWVPLEQARTGAAPGEGRPLVVFGRLARGISPEAAQAELDALGAPTGSPQALEHVPPKIMPFALAVRPLPDIGPVGLIAVNVFMLMLFVLISGSVALLAWARAATRAREMAVRSALGAGRGRIAMQFFTEALVLGTVAAALGLVAADYGVGLYVAMSEADSGPVPFWVDRSIGFPTVVYLCGLTLLGSVIVGVVPAFRVTGRNVDARLRRTHRGGGLRLHGLWGKVIVAQIAVTIAFPATSFFFQRYVSTLRTFDLGFEENAFVSARLELAALDGQQEEEPAVRLATTYDRLKERLQREPSVAGVTFSSHLPGTGIPRVRVELDGPGPSSIQPRRVKTTSVDADFFKEMGAPIEVGRGFISSDEDSDVGVIVVDRAFVDALLQGRSAVGRRLRVWPPDGTSPGPWLEIVGVVGGLAMVDADNLDVGSSPGFYQVLPTGSANSLNIAIQVPGGVEGFASTLRTAAAEVDPRLRVLEVRDMSRVSESLWRESEFLYRVLAGVSLVALALSLTAIFSVLSLTVSQRTREIGIRVALGSGRPEVVTAMFGRPLAYVVTGIALGGVLVALLVLAGRGSLDATDVAWVLVYSATMFGVCLSACVVPTRRALDVEPMEALRTEA